MVVGGRSRRGRSCQADTGYVKTEDVGKARKRRRESRQEVTRTGSFAARPGDLERAPSDERSYMAAGRPAAARDSGVIVPFSSECFFSSSRPTRGMRIKRFSLQLLGPRIEVSLFIKRRRPSPMVPPHRCATNNRPLCQRFQTRGSSIDIGDSDHPDRQSDFGWGKPQQLVTISVTVTHSMFVKSSQ